MLLVTKKSSKLPWKKFCTLIDFTLRKSTLFNHELCTVSQDFFITVVQWFKILCALSKYFWIVFKFLSSCIIYVFIDCIFWTDHISLCKLDLFYLYIIITNYYYMYFIVETHSVLLLLLSIDKFYIHSDGSLEY
jgi:hypothetical protein